MRHLIILLVAVSLYSRFSLAACADMVDELRAMKTAQASVQNALISNHELFATTLESYSESLSQVSGRTQKVMAMTMDKSAQSFRDRGVKAQKTSMKLNAATESLIERIAQCLK